MRSKSFDAEDHEPTTTRVSRLSSALVFSGKILEREKFLYLMLADGELLPIS